MATKKLTDMSVAELRARLKQATGRSTKDSNKKKLIEAIEQHSRYEQRVKDAAKAPKARARGRRASAVVAGQQADSVQTADGTGSDAAPAPAKVRGKWALMSNEELRRMYEEKIGRPTGSDDRGYLIWKLREAEKGRIAIGPVKRRAMTEEPTIPITLRLPTSLAEQADAAWRRRNYRSRVHLIELSIGLGLKKLGEAELGAAFERRCELRVGGARAGEEG